MSDVRLVNRDQQGGVGAAFAERRTATFRYPQPPPRLANAGERADMPRQLLAVVGGLLDELPVELLPVFPHDPAVFGGLLPLFPLLPQSRTAFAGTRATGLVGDVWLHPTANSDTTVSEARRRFMRFSIAGCLLRAGTRRRARRCAGGEPSHKRQYQAAAVKNSNS